MPNFIVSKFVFHFTLQTRTPSAPRNAISNVNETSVFLEWIPPADTGGRKDVSYYIACKCNSHAGVCECGGHVRYTPPANRPEKHLCHGGGSARSHKLYTEIEAVNGVSDLGQGARQYVSVNVTTIKQVSVMSNPSMYLRTSSVSYLPSSGLSCLRSVKKNFQGVRT